MSATVNISLPKNKILNNYQIIENFDTYSTKYTKEYIQQIQYGVCCDKNYYEIFSKLINYKLVLENFTSCNYVIKCNVNFPN